MGAITVRALQSHARLRLIDRAWPAGAGTVAGAEYVTADLRAPHSAELALGGADVVVHLAANASPQQSAVRAVEGVGLIAANVADALEKNGTGRLVFASSVHAMGMYDVEGEHPARSAWKQRPCCEYGASKVLTENIFELLHRRTGTSVLGLRLGLTGYAPPNAQYAMQWLGDRDYSRMVRAAITVEEGFALVFAMSGAAAARWDLEETERVLGVSPSDSPVIAPSGNGEQEARGRCLMMRGMSAAPGRALDDGT